MLIKGSVPGPIGACVRMYKTTRPRAREGRARLREKGGEGRAREAKPEK
jgi:hypothetical protein